MQGGVRVAVQPPSHLGEHHPGGGVAFERPRIAAAAQRPLLVDTDVPDLSGPAAHAPVQPPAQQHARTDPGGGLDIDQVGGALQLTKLPLGQRAQVGVVVDQHRGAEDWRKNGPQRTGHVLTVPAGHVGRPDDLAGAEIDRAGNAHAHSGHALLRYARLTQHLQRQRADQRVGGGRPGTDVVGTLTARQQLTAQVEKRDPDVTGPQIDAQQVGGGLVQRQHGGAAAHPVTDPRLAFLHQSRGQQVLHDAADGAARQPDLPRQIDTRRVLLPEELEQQKTVLDAHSGHV